MKPLSISSRRGSALIVCAGLALAHLGMALVYLLNRAPGTDAAATGFPLDDAWIHMVYARNLAEGAGFSYNPGQLESGFTSPLWAILLAPLFWIPGLDGLDGAGIVWGAKILGTVLSLCASLLAYRLVRAVGAGRIAAWAAALMLAVDPALGFARVSGMEVSLAVAAILWTLLALAERRPARAGFGIACCALARPELGLFALFVLPVMWRHLGHRRLGLRIAAFAPLPAAGGAWMLYNFAVIGHPLPTTFYVKSDFLKQGFGALHDLSVIGPVLMNLPWFFWGAGVPLFILGGWRLLRLRAEIALPVLGMAMLFPFALSLSADMLEAGAFYWDRYLFPVIPFLYIPVALAVDFAAGAWRKRKLLPALGISVLFAVGAAQLPSRVAASAELYAWNCQNINEVQVAIGKWLRENVSPYETVGLVDAGAMRYFSGSRAVDLIGLNTHEVVFQGPMAVLAAYRPRYFVIFPHFQPEYFRNGGFRLIHQANAPRYTICTCDQAAMVVLERM